MLLITPAVQAKKPRRETSAAVSVVFSSGDARAIHEYYRAYPPSLPPGLRKKLARGGSLPPGWQKKIVPLPVELERRLVPLGCGDCRRGYVDGHAVIYSPRTMVVLDVLALF
ncbi:MAG: hypothetical protein HY013_07645 [Candidatus Solibacter usitatus]|nr:hypothetical protein [Candidatus Solibacter usitatus]